MGKKNAELVGMCFDRKIDKVNFTKPLKSLTRTQLLTILEFMDDSVKVGTVSEIIESLDTKKVRKIIAEAGREITKEREQAVLWKAKAIGLSEEQLEDFRKLINTTGDLRHAMNWLDLIQRQKKNKKDKLAVFARDVKKYYGIAEKILEGLLESGFGREGDAGYVIFDSGRQKSKVIEAIAGALVKNLTYGNLGTLTLRNNDGRIVAKLYILPDGTLADDSWLCNEGWK